MEGAFLENAFWKTSKRNERGELPGAASCHYD